MVFSGDAAPADVRWSAAGFSLELGRLRRPRALESRTRHVWALTVPLYLVALGIELSFVGSAFVLGTALVLVARQAMWFDERRLSVLPFELRVGRRRVPAHALLGCDVRGHSLVLRTRDGTWPLDVAGLAPSEREWLRDQIVAVRDRWQARQGPVPSALGPLLEERRRVSGCARSERPATDRERDDGRPGGEQQVQQ